MDKRIFQNNPKAPKTNQSINCKFAWSNGKVKFQKSHFKKGERNE